VSELSARSAESLRWAQRFWDVTEGKSTAALDDLVDDDCEFHDVRYAPVVGKEAGRLWGEALFLGMPDSTKTKTYHVVATDRTVIGEFEYAGTHTGTYYGFPATGNSVRWDCVIIYKFNDEGRLVFMKNYNDTRALENQLRKPLATGVVS
jgi:steroid delta-isomerase-like uncharacterized protein